MKTHFGKHIISLLKEHECVVLPKVGALVLKNNPAYIAKGQIFAASKEIVFNKNISTNDKLISSALISEGLTYLEAETEVQHLVTDLKFNLSQKGYYDIDHLGRFTSVKQEINFVANTATENLDKQSFGFENLSIFPVQREIVSAEKQKIEISKTTIAKPETATKTKAIRNTSLIGLAASFTLIFAMVSLMYTNTSFEKLQVKNANVLNFLLPAESAIAVKSSALKSANKTELKNLSPRQEQRQDSLFVAPKESKVKPAGLEELSNKLKQPEVEQEIVEKKATPKAENVEVINKEYQNILKVKANNPIGFYVITGAYSNLNNANKAKEICSIENACSIFKTSTGLYRVGIYTSTEKELAVLILEDYKKTKPNYWLMENN